MKKLWASEEALATAVSGWLAADGWETYHEVGGGGGSNRADIVATRGHLVWVVECKLRLGLEVLAQAEGWIGSAHFVSVAVPADSRGRVTWFAEQIAAERGVGVIRVPHPSNVEHGDVDTHYAFEDGDWKPTTTEPRGCSFWHTDAPRLNRHASVTKLRSWLVDEHKSSRPGTARTHYHTPFRETCKRIQAHVAGSGGRSLVRDTIKAVDHHYASDSSARCHLVDRVRAGIVPGLRVEQDGRALLFVVDTTEARTV